MLTRRHMTAGLASFALLGGCDNGSRRSGFRNVSQPLTVTTRSDLSALSGPWFVRARFPVDRGLAMVTFLPNADNGPAIEYRTESCLLSGDCTSEIQVEPLDMLGPRRARDRGTGREFWLIWIDESLRTAAIGTPDGSYAWVLDRKPTGGLDRITAAREVLEFNGYDVTRLSLREIG